MNIGCVRYAEDSTFPSFTLICPNDGSSSNPAGNVSGRLPERFTLPNNPSAMATSVALQVTVRGQLRELESAQGMVIADPLRMFIGCCTLMAGNCQSASVQLPPEALRSSARSCFLRACHSARQLVASEARQCGGDVSAPASSQYIKLGFF